MKCHNLPRICQGNAKLLLIATAQHFQAVERCVCLSNKRWWIGLCKTCTTGILCSFQPEEGDVGAGACTALSWLCLVHSLGADELVVFCNMSTCATYTSQHDRLSALPVQLVGCTCTRHVSTLILLQT